MANEYCTGKGKIMGFCNGYIMSFRRVRQHDGKWIWRCTKKGCGGTATSANGEDLVEENLHYGHLPDKELVEVRCLFLGQKRISDAVLAAESNRDTPARSIVDGAFEGLSGELLHTMPARETLRARLTRHRSKDIGAVNRGDNSTEWPDSVKQTKDGRAFLHYDSATDRYLGPPLEPGFIGPAPPPRFLIFTTADLLRLLQEKRHWAMDGTFFAAPKDYKQMYVVGFYAVNADGTSYFYPCIYLLLQSKKEETYREVFSKVFQQFTFGQFSTSVMIEGENKKSLGNFGRQNGASLLACFILLPIGEVENGYDELRAAKNDLISRQIIPCDAVVHVNKLFAYFERNYIRRPNGNDAIYPASLWNMHDRTRDGLPRTNNGVENWNGQFNSYFRHHDPALADVIFKLQIDEEKTRQNIETRTRNPLTRITGGVRSQRAIFSGNQIQQLVANYRNGTGLLRVEFLVSIAAHLEKYQGH